MSILLQDESIVRGGHQQNLTCPVRHQVIESSDTYLTATKASVHSKTPAVELTKRLEQSLIHHGVRYLDEPSDVGSVYIVHEITLLTIFNTGSVNFLHDN